MTDLARLSGWGYCLHMHEPYIGAHMSIAGGLSKAFERIEAVNGTALQIFTRNQRQWKFPPITEADAACFAEAWTHWGKYPIAAHDSYLINLANPDSTKAERAIAGFAEELRRVEQLGISWLVTHPGSHLGQGIEQGIARYVANLDQALELSDTQTAMVLLETTAGQGTNLGSDFNELAAIIQTSRNAGRIGVCLDTCHVFAAGYDIRTGKGVEQMLATFDQTIGLDRLKFLHLNDSKNPLGSRKDRHEHIGQGEIGLEGFRALVNHTQTRNLPMTLETPKEDDLDNDRANLAVLRGLIG